MADAPASQGATAEPNKDSAVETTKAASGQAAAVSSTEEPSHKEPELAKCHIAETSLLKKTEVAQDTPFRNAPESKSASSAVPTSSEAPSVKKDEAEAKPPDPAVPEAPLSANEASVADPAISVPAATSTTGPASTVEAVPDPDEDDLDDLDELLDEFSTTKLDSNEPVPNASGPGRPAESDTAAATATERDAATAPNPAFPNFPFDPLAPMPLDDDDFAKQLNAGMADLLGELESSPEMQQQFEQMLRELGSASAAAEAGGATSASGPHLSFQESIQRTMERMQESSDTAGAAAANASQSESDFMAALLQQMDSGGSGSEEDFSKMLLGMMEQLTNKEILYEPMKELDQKFPEWMTKNKDSVSADDLKRYEEQQKIVGEIVAKFEEPGYSDDNVESRQFIVDRMQKMQAAGSPPSDLVGDMDAAQEALGNLDAGCPTQ